MLVGDQAQIEPFLAAAEAVRSRVEIFHLQRGACPLHGSTAGTARCFSVNTNAHTFHCFKCNRSKHAKTLAEWRPEGTSQ